MNLRRGKTMSDKTSKCIREDKKIIQRDDI